MNSGRILALVVAGLCVAVVLGSATTADACPSCEQALESGSGQGDLARGIYYSVLFMMAMPFAIIGTFSGLAYRAVKLERRRLAELAQREAEAERLDH